VVHFMPLELLSYQTRSMIHSDDTWIMYRKKMVQVRRQLSVERTSATLRALFHLQSVHLSRFLSFGRESLPQKIGFRATHRACVVSVIFVEGITTLV
jgi:hypothetical protein